MKSHALASDTYPAEICRAKGVATVKELVERTKMRTQTVIDLLLCRSDTVFLQNGDYSLAAQEFALFIGLPPDMLYGEHPEADQRRIEAEQVFAESYAVQPVEPLDYVIRQNLLETTTRVLASITPREQRILRMRFGIGQGDDILEEAGQEFSVSRERIRQIEATALRKLKHPSRDRKLRRFLDFGFEIDEHADIRAELLLHEQDCLEG
jgi:RNA polymerase sigma factor (sigma-70 family)